MRCDFCGDIIKVGEYYYDIDGDIVCRDCIDSYLEDFASEHIERCEEAEEESDFEDSL